VTVPRLSFLCKAEKQQCGLEPHRTPIARQKMEVSCKEGKRRSNAQKGSREMI